MTYPDQARWFDALGVCDALGCKRPATGTVRGPRNDSYGHYCQRCADKRLAAARKAREAYAKTEEAKVDP